MMATRKTKTPANKSRIEMLSGVNKHFFPDKEKVNQVFIMLSDQITTKACDDVIADLINMNAPHFEEDDKGNMKRIENKMNLDVINLVINSEGGDLVAAIALVEVIQASVIPVRTIVIGECASAALVIFMSGHQRVVTPTASLLSHQLSSGGEGTYSNMKATMKAMTMYHDLMVSHYEKFTGLPRDVIEKELLNSEDVILTPEDARGFELCDVIMDLK
jgi:ATP-dependent protease ClpP protease subunit